MDNRHRTTVQGHLDKARKGEERGLPSVLRIACDVVLCYHGTLFGILCAKKSINRVVVAAARQTLGRLCAEQRGYSFGSAHIQKGQRDALHYELVGERSTEVDPIHVQVVHIIINESS